MKEEAEIESLRKKKLQSLLLENKVVKEIKNIDLEWFLANRNEQNNNKFDSAI